MANLLDGLLKEATEQGLLKKAKKSPISMSKKDQYAYVPVADRFKSVSIILIEHVTTCECCESEWLTPNQLLVKRLSPKGDMHYKSQITRSEYEELPRETESKSYTVKACSNCFEEQSWDSYNMKEKTETGFVESLEELYGDLDLYDESGELIVEEAESNQDLGQNNGLDIPDPEGEL